MVAIKKVFLSSGVEFSYMIQATLKTALLQVMLYRDDIIFTKAHFYVKCLLS